MLCSASEAGHYADELGDLQGLCNVELVASEDSVGAVLWTRICGDCSRSQSATVASFLLTDASDELVPIHVGHTDIAQQYVRAPAFQDAERFLSGSGCSDARASLF